MTAVASLLAQLAGLAALAPELVESEVRPLVADLAARQRTCARCGEIFLGKSLARRGRFFCSDACRFRARNKNNMRASTRKALLAPANPVTFDS